MPVARNSFRSGTGRARVCVPEGDRPTIIAGDHRGAEALRDGCPLAADLTYSGTKVAARRGDLPMSEYLLDVDEGDVGIGDQAQSERVTQIVQADVGPELVVDRSVSGPPHSPPTRRRHPHITTGDMSSHQVTALSHPKRPAPRGRVRAVHSDLHRLCLRRSEVQPGPIGAAPDTDPAENRAAFPAHACRSGAATASGTRVAHSCA